MATERETRASINDALKKEHANLKKESERLKSNIERSKREIDALREQNARLSRTLARYQREGLELKREERRVTLRREEERRETEYAEVLRDAFDMNPLENGERENPSQVLRRVYREMVEECDRDIEEALQRELEREKNREQLVREKKVKSEHFLEIQNVEEKGVIQTHMWKILHSKIHNTINKHTYTINTHISQHQT